MFAILKESDDECLRHCPRVCEGKSGASKIETDMIRRGNSKPRPTIFTYYNDESAGNTEFRRLVRGIRHRGNPSEVESVLVTSATKDEGKSLIAAYLAIAIAKKENDKKVLLIDCDLRRPQVYSLFGVEREPGLMSLLMGEAEPSDVTRDTELGNLKIIPSGRSVDSPTQVLAGAREALDRCKGLFDIVICDAPPVVPVDDVGILGQCVDGVLLVVLAGKTDRLVVKRAVDILRDAHAEVLGVILNDLHKTLPYYYDYRYYRYGYENMEAPGEESGIENLGGYDAFVPRYRWSRVHRL